jgi:membrane-bound lytic murein transglycosylase A
MFRALVDVCRKAVASPEFDAAGAREFFERHFRPALINKVGETEGFITGYYEPVVVGSPFRTEEFQVPLYQRPSNLIPLGKRRKAGEFPNNVKVGRRVGRRKIVPYFDRTDIENGDRSRRR